ncbi:MAG: rubrerythrin family protein [Christensenellaceae bacterium]|jgi:rubrerythrin|nr:rubrerythrin family protein [Christensenellaceae bacterium]
MLLKDSKTFLHLAEAFAGECMARTRYEFIEYGARMAGNTALADILAKIAFNEFNHARMLYTFLQKGHKSTISNINISSGYPFKEKWDVLENLKLASENEREEAFEIYPKHAEIAKTEGFEDIEKLFLNIASVEKSHSLLLAELYKQMKTNCMYKKENSVEWRCADCGYTFKGSDVFAECPLCEAKTGHVSIKLATCSI